MKEPLFDWIEMENPDKVDNDANHEETYNDSRFFYIVKCDHEDDEVVSIPKQHDDPFTKTLCPIKKAKSISNIDDLEEDR
ncbi:hypothetical protein LXL04_017576 [Taraxacum kok-saghyz]